MVSQSKIRTERLFEKLRSMFTEPGMGNAPLTRKKAAVMLRILDRYLGCYCLYFTVVIFLHWNQADWNAKVMAPLALLFTFGNLAFSQCSMKSKNPGKPEAIRFFFGVIMMTVLHSNAGSVIENFWFPFMVYSIGFPTISQIAIGLKRWVIISFVPGFYLVLRLGTYPDLTTFLTSPDPLICGALLMTTMFSYKVTQTLQNIGRELEIEKNKVEQKVLEKTEELKLAHATRIESEKFAALGEMAGGIAHEINTPLGAILLSSQSIKKMIDEQKVDLQRVNKLAQGIEKTTNRIAKITKALRTFSRRGTTDPFLHTSLAELIDEALALVSEKYRMSMIDIRFDSKAASHVSFECQETQIGQVLINLLNNARHAAEKETERWVSLEVKDAGEFFELYIRDSGKGIPKSVSDKMFDPFFTTKQVGKGTGLGMAISRQIIEFHAGKLELLDDEKNTTFRITLPKLQDRQRFKEMKPQQLTAA